MVIVMIMLVVIDVVLVVSTWLVVIDVVVVVIDVVIVMIMLVYSRSPLSLSRSQPPAVSYGGESPCCGHRLAHNHLPVTANTPHTKKTLLWTSSL